jgi:hypothetical protein
MSLITERAQVARWGEPDGIAPRGTLILIPGRGERPELYERLRLGAVLPPVAVSGKL